MIFDYEVIRFIWWVIIGVVLIGFTITDGFDMGVGILLPIIGKTNNERRIMINSISPHWDGNQVWFVTAGAALFAVWPMVYAASFSGFYIAMLLVLCSLFFRPLGFDYRGKLDSTKWRQAWDYGIFFGSFTPAFVFGVAFGNLLQGVPFTLDTSSRISYEGGFFGLLNPLGIFSGIVSLALIITQGGAWLQLKTKGELYERSCKATQISALVMMAAFLISGICIIFFQHGYAIISFIDTNADSNPMYKTVTTDTTWLNNFNNTPILWIIPIFGIFLPLATVKFSKMRRNALVFLTSSLTIICVLLTFGIATFPFIMPSSITPNFSLTIWDSTSSKMTLTVVFWVIAVLLPVVLSYTVWSYMKMFGRLDDDYIEANDHSLY